MNQDVLIFGDCSIHIASRELVRAGKRINLSPIVFDCIAYLIEHRDRAVGRDELVAAVWGKTSVSDAVMGKTILTARRAIGDTAEEQRFLRTVPRYGYQWGAQTRTSEAPSPITAEEPATPRKSRRHRGRVALLVGIVLLLALALGVWEWRKANIGGIATPATIGSELPADLTVVLPVDVMGAAGDEWLRLGLMDLIAMRLRNAGVSVLSSDNVVRLVPAGMTRDAAIARVRGIAERSHLVTPLVRRSGADWIVRADLLESDGTEHTVEAQTDNVITAAAGAADRLLELLGKRAPHDVMNAAQLSQTELLQRVDAARLAGDPTRARALITAADPALQEVAEVQLRLAQIDLRIGEFEAALQRLDVLVSKVAAESDPSLHARLQSYRCIALARRGRYDEAIGACDEAITLLESRNQPDELGRVYSDRGIIRTLQGQYDLSAKDFARARVALNLAGDALLLAKVDGNESNLDMAQGRYAEAIAIQQRIGQRFERFGMANEFVASLNNQTTAHLALLQPLDALRTNDQALAQLGHVTDASIRYFTRLQRADTLETNGRLGEARILLDEVIEETSAAQYAPERATARASEARLDLIGGQPAAALLLARQAIASLPAPPYGSVRAGAWLSILRSLHRLGRTDEGATELGTFAAWAKTDEDPVVALYSQLGAAEQAAVEHRVADAGARYEEALASAKRWGVPNTLAETVTSYGRFLLARGELQQASVVIGLVARYADSDFDCAALQARLYRALGQEPAAQAALAQMRRLAGERPLPPDLSDAAPSGNGDTPIGNNAATGSQQKRHSPTIAARLPAT